MEKYAVTGMTCAACQNRVEKAVSKLDGVTSCSVSLLTNSMAVEGTASEKEIIKAVTDAGYGAHIMGKKNESAEEENELLIDRETPVLKKRLIRSVIFLLILMYLSMGHNMLNLPVPAFLENPVAMALTQMLIAIITMIINSKFFTSGFGSLMHGSPNMDTLVALGSAASFGYSLAELYLMIDYQAVGNHEMAHHLMHNLYFESAAMIPTLITVGKLLEAISKGRTTDALKSLIRMSPKTAVLDVEGQEKTVEIASVKVSDVFVVKSGDMIPVDGEIIYGHGSIDESSLTGESIPVDKQTGDQISSGTILSAGYLKARALRVGEDTTLSQIIKMITDAAATKAPIARIADTVSGYFVPAVIIISLLTLGGWLLAGKDFSFAIGRAISVLVISCPCALGLATPVAIMVGNGVGFRNGILFKNAVALEEAGKMQIIALDKTGTITEGKPEVTDVISYIDEEEFLSLAVSMERMSEHPLALAVSEYGENNDVKTVEIADFMTLAGNGIKARYQNRDIYGGSLKFISSLIELPADIRRKIEELAGQGKTPLMFGEEGKLYGIISVADKIKDDSREAVRQLEDLGIEVIMLTGDNKITAENIAKKAGISRVVAQVLPSGKQNIIKKLQKYGKVMMVGDGINDAVALTQADLGVAIGAGTDVAVDAADIVLSKNRLTDVAAAVRLSRATLVNIKENLFWAFFYNVICIPLAIGLYQLIFKVNWQMNPMLGAAAMSLSSFTVCSNALRLNGFKLYEDKGRKIKNNLNIEIEEEVTEMKKTLKIEGMMCMHCEATVKKALEKVDGVVSAEVSHEKGTAIVTLSQPVDDAVLAKAVTDKDYEVLEVISD